MSQGTCVSVVVDYKAGSAYTLKLIARYDHYIIESYHSSVAFLCSRSRSLLIQFTCLRNSLHVIASLYVVFCFHTEIIH